jgi:hypothetical protein
MTAVGTFSVMKIVETPKVEPWVATMEKQLNPKRAVMTPPPPVPAWNNPWDKTLLTARSITPGGERVLPRLMYVADPPHPIMEVFVLPFPVISDAKADLNGTTLTWTLQEPPQEKLDSWKTQKTAKPAGFVIKRAYGNEEHKELAKVGPDAKSFTDLSAEPKQTYRYWVLVTGEETKRDSNAAEKKPVTKGLDASVKATSPSASRVKLIGGDRTNAVLRVETYDRAQKKWISKGTVVVAPGRDIGTSGWILRKLHFDNFTLVADLTDDEGVDRVQTP